MTTKCNATHIQEYKNAINNYLKSKNITDYEYLWILLTVKYLLSRINYIFDLWNCPSIIKRPVNIQPSPNILSSKYYDTHTRTLIIQTVNNRNTLFINAFVEYVQQDSVNKVLVDNIIRTDMFWNSGWEYTHFSGSMYSLINIWLIWSTRNWKNKNNNFISSCQ
jgi:hypothetical protein